MKTITLKNLFAVTMVLVAATSTVSTALAQSNYEPYSFATLAGIEPGSGGLGGDGTGSHARFYYPSGVAVDSAGNVYVADTFNNTIRKITPSGVVSTFAGLAGSPGSADGTGCAARFLAPFGVAVDSAGNVYVADSGNNTIRKITPSGVVSTFAGLAGSPGSTDGNGSAARFRYPFGVAVDSMSNVYVADSENQTIRKITPSGDVSTPAGSPGMAGYADGPGSAARFHFPRGVAVDSAGNLYVADTDNHTIRKITLTPSVVVSTPAGSPGMPGSADGPGSAARFNYPGGVAVDSAGNLYVADSDNHTIRKITLTPSVVVSTPAGLALHPGSHDGTGSAARFYFPRGVAVDHSTGNIYVADEDNYTIREITLTPSVVVNTFAGSAGTGSRNGTGSAARFNYPQGAAVDSVGNLYVADTNNHTIRKITPSGVVSIFAGSAGHPGITNGTGSAARFNFPRGVVLDSVGNVYVADTSNSTIRKITPSGVVSTFAGSAGNIGHADGTGSAARFYQPQGVAVDSADNVYVADTTNHTIRKITPSGDVITFAGLALHRGHADGTGNDARFFSPKGVAVDSTGNVYVADYNNSTIRKITPSRLVSTFAGSALSPGSADGTGSAARFNAPSGVAVDNSAGNLYVADTLNHTIRKITPFAVVSTLAGLAGSTGSADGAGSDARFYYPSGVVVDNSANKVYVGDTNNTTVRVGVTAPPVITTVGQLFVYQLESAGTTSLMVNNLPPGLSFPDPQLAAIIGVPSATGTFPVAISATYPPNGIYPGVTTNSPLTIMVQSPPGSGPVITSGTSATARVGQLLNFQVYTTGSSPAATVSATGLPPGLSLNPVTGIISGSATTSGSSLVKLTVTDGIFTPTATLQLTFTADRVLPVILSPSDAFLYPGQSFSYTMASTSPCDGEVPTFAYLGTDGVLNGTLPPGLSFDGINTISGTYSPTPTPMPRDRSTLIAGDDVVSPDRTIRPPFIAICQPFARNSGGGMGQAFTTNGGAGTVPLNFLCGGPTTNPATAVASFSATLNGSLNPVGVTTTVYFQYGTTTNYTFTTPPQTKTGNMYLSINANISSLTASTTYHFRMVATNNAGTVYGADGTFTTLRATGPPVVTTSPATDVTSSSATLNGSLDPHGLMTTVQFRWGTTTSYGNTTLIQTQTGNTFRNITANIGSVTTHTTYHFRIVATNSAGTRMGGDRTFTTP